MALVPLLGGAYKAPSIIAGAQRCINLFPEVNPKDAKFPTTHYPTPGLTLLANAPTSGIGRGVYCDSQGNLYCVVGNTVYQVSSTWVMTKIGTIATYTTPVSFTDNGLAAVIVDGSTTGYAINISTVPQNNVVTPLYAFGTIGDSNFLGATKADYVDTFFVFNQPGTNLMYSSLSDVTFTNLTTAVGSIQTGNVTSHFVGAILTGAITSGGTAYTPGTYNNVPLTGGSGSGATANIVVNGSGVITSVTLVVIGVNYLQGDILSATVVGGSGFTYAVNSVELLGGTGYTPGTYTGVSMLGGTGSGAIATLVVGGSGNVTSVTFTNEGQGYVVGDILTANLSGGINFQYTVATVATSGQAFDPLYIAGKTGYPDPLVTLQVVHREIWFIGTKTAEVWYDAGASDFPFQIMPGAFIEHGCAAPYSVAAADLQVMWLSKDKQGQAIVLRGEGYQVRRISTHAQEAEFQTYATISDAVAYTYQQQGHTFYVLSFPTANTTWVFDVATGLWHQRAYSDVNGILNRHRGQLGAAAFGVNVVQDWQTGALYKLDQTNFTDNGQAMQFIRGWPTISNEGKRTKYKTFIADMEVGTDTGAVDGSTQANPPVVSLRWSDDGGKTYGNPVTQSLGALGLYNQSVKWSRLGQGRNRVFELSWSCPTKTALNGAWIDPEAMGS